MDYKTASEAYLSITRLNSVRFGIKDAFSVYKLRKKLEDVYNFFVEEQRKIIEKYNGEILEDGRIQFDSNETAEKARNDIESLNNSSIDVDIEPITINISEIQDGTMTPRDIEMLDGFIIFC